MTIWTIEPRDPLIVRDGRPFGPDPGARATSLPFPLPSTVAGGVRTLAGRVNGIFDPTLTNTVLKDVRVRGPLLVALQDTKVVYYAPAPADATIHPLETPDEQQGKLIPLVPLTLPAAAVSNLPGDLLPVGQLGVPDTYKPHPNAPRFWCWEHFETWLKEPQEQEINLTSYGIKALETNTRMHVSIVPETQTAREGFLYQTRGLEFTTRKHQRLALAADVVYTDQRLFTSFNGGMAPLGGERRLMRWEQHTDRKLPDAPPDLFKTIGEQRACRIILLTPAYFTSGYIPNVTAPVCGLCPRLIAAAVPRAQIASGWDMAYEHQNGERGAPKPTRRLALAGSVYFIRFDQNDDPQQIEQWAQKRWMTCISECEQDQRDGFGLAVLGVWDGQVVPMGG